MNTSTCMASHDARFLFDPNEYPDFKSRAVNGCAPDLDRGYEALGFSSIGQIMAFPVRDDDEVQIYEGRDGEHANAYMEHGLYNTLLVSPDRTTQVEPETAHDFDSQRLRTLFDTGDVAETSSVPPRILPTCHGIPGQHGELTPAARQKIEMRERGTISKAGLWRQQILEEDPATLWAAHQEWIREIGRRVGGTPLPVKDLTQVLAVTRQMFEADIAHAACRTRQMVLLRLVLFPLVVAAVWMLQLVPQGNLHVCATATGVLWLASVFRLPAHIMNITRPATWCRHYWPLALASLVVAVSFIARGEPRESALRTTGTVMLCWFAAEVLMALYYLWVVNLTAGWFAKRPVPGREVASAFPPSPPPIEEWPRYLLAQPTATTETTQRGRASQET